jgi:hypothetical protein
LNIFVPTTGLRAIDYAKMLSESSSSSKTNKRLLPLPAPVPRRRIAITDPDIDGGDVDIDIDQGDPDIDQGDPDIDQGDPGSAVPVADVAIDQGDPDLDGGDEEGGVGEYASFILGAKVQWYGHGYIVGKSSFEFFEITFKVVVESSVELIVEIIIEIILEIMFEIVLKLVVETNVGIIVGITFQIIFETIHRQHSKSASLKRLVLNHMPVCNLSPDKNNPHMFLSLTLSLPFIEAHRRLQSNVAGMMSTGLTTTVCTLRAPMLLTRIVIAAEASCWTWGVSAIRRLRFILARGWLRPTCPEIGTESGGRTSKTWSDSERIPHPIEWEMKQNMSKRNRRFMGVCTVSSSPPPLRSQLNHNPDKNLHNFNNSFTF